MSDSHAHAWKVLLIGGCSGIGKTVAAQQLAGHLGISALLVDDIRLALQQVTTPAQQPALHYFLTGPDVWQRPPEELRDGLIGVAQAIVPALEIIIAHHVAVSGAGAIIVEGDGILPRLALKQRFPNLRHFSALELRDEVRAVFLDEPDEQALFQNMHMRGRGFQETPTAEQRAQTRTSWLYGRWLREEAQRAGLPILPARPWATLAERILAAIGQALR